MTSFEDVYDYEFGKFPKKKYKLYVDNTVAYFFTTTNRSEQEAINEMMNIIEMRQYQFRARYKISVVEDQKEKILKSGKF